MAMDLFDLLGRISVNMTGFDNAMNQVQSETDNIRRSMNGIDGEINNSLTNSSNSLRETLEANAQSLTDTGKKMTLGLTTPLAGVAVAVTKTAMDFEQEMSRAGAVAEATNAELEQMTATAMTLGSETSKSATEVAGAMTELAAAGFDAKNIIGAMPGIISASEASGESLALASEVVGSALSIWSMKAEESAHVADVLAMAANKSKASIHDMGYALKYAGAPAAMLGINLEELAAAVGLITDAGIDGSTAGTSLRAGLIALAEPVEKSQKLMDKIGFSARNSEGDAKSLAEIVQDLGASLEGMNDADKVGTMKQLVGTESVSAFLSLISAGPEKLEAFTKALEESDGAAKAAADKMKDNLAGQLEELGGSLETLSIQLGNILIPIVRDAAKWLQKVVDKFAALSPETQRTILMFGAFVAAIGPILMITGTLIRSVANIIGVLSKVGRVFGLSAGAVGRFGGVFARILPFILRFIPGIGLIVTAVSLIVGVFKMAGVDILGGLAAGFRFGLELAITAISWVGEQIINFFKSLFGIASPSKLFRQFGVWIMEGLAGGIRSMLSMVKGLFTQVFNGMKRIASGAINSIKTNATAGFTNIANGARTMATNISSAVSSAFSNAVTTAQGFVTKAKELGSNIASGISSGINSGKEWVSNAISSVSEKALGVFKKDNEIKSPSRLYKRTAAWLPAGIEMAIHEGIPKVASAMKSLSKATNEKFGTSFNVDATASLANLSSLFSYELPRLDLPPNLSLPDASQLMGTSGMVVHGGLHVNVDQATDLTPRQLQNQAERDFLAKARQKV